MIDKREKKIALINQMLAKAESTTPAKAESTTPEEAEALTAAAEALMIQYQIETAELQAASGQTAEVIELLHVLDGAQYAEARRWSLCIALEGLGQVTSYYWQNRRTGYVALVIVGVKDDAEQALRLAESLDRQQMHAMRAWWKRERRWWDWATESEKLGERRGFIIGFGNGVRERLEAARAAATSSLSDSTALVLVGNRARVDEHLDSLGLGKARAREVPGSGTSRGDGRKAGLEANTATDHEVTQQRKAVAA